MPVALEARQVAHDLDERLAGDVLGVRRAPRAQEPEHAGGERGVDLAPCPLLARSGGDQGLLEALGFHIALARSETASTRRIL